MTGFSANWLALREPADHASINAMTRARLCSYFQDRDHLKIVDLGSGTGSNLRCLAPYLNANRQLKQSWLLVDNDEALLSQATHKPLQNITVHRARHDLSNGNLEGIINDADLVTASALFDLISPNIITKMASQIIANGQVFYTVLTYDGIASWLPEHPLNATMRQHFNTHQQTDKGFGAAAGPSATTCLEKAFEAASYEIIRAPSPWILSGEYNALRFAVDEGWAQAVRETGKLQEPKIDDWLSCRRRAQNAVTIVGHEDILALPPK